MWYKLGIAVLVLAIPAHSSAGPLTAAIEQAARELAAAQESPQTRTRARTWTALSLIAGGAALTALGTMELGDDEDGPDDAEDFEESDDGEDADGWGNKAMIGGGVAAAAAGAVILFRGRQAAGPRVSIRPGRVAVHQTLRF